MSRILIMGQAPGKVHGPPIAGKAGAFIRKLCGGITEERFAKLFERKNLLDFYPGARAKGDRFPAKHARIVAAAIESTFVDRDVILLGRSVADAFAFPEDVRPLVWVLTWTSSGTPFRCALVPHPSGVNRFWNEHRNRVEGCRFFGRIARGDDAEPSLRIERRGTK